VSCVEGGRMVPQVKPGYEPVTMPGAVDSCSSCPHRRRSSVMSTQKRTLIVEDDRHADRLGVAG
jgi:hypothetical protein